MPLNPTPEKGDEWITDIGDLVIIHEVNLIFYGTPDKYPIKGTVLGAYKYTSWNLDGESSIGKHLNLVKLHKREKQTTERKDDSLDYFRGIISKNVPGSALE